LKRLALALVLVPLSVIACERITRLSDLRVEQPQSAADAAPPDTGPPACTGLAARCPANGQDLRHPPCPNASDTPDDGQVYVYAWRKLRLGVNPDPTKTMDPSQYDTNVGYDLDCSDRKPTGLPVLCQAQLFDSGVPAWQVFPKGIDNAVAQRVLGPLNVASYQNNPDTFVSLDDRFTTQLEAGHGSVLTIVYNWNGTDDDPKVSVRLVSALGTTDGNAPKWDGSDKWIAATAQADPDLHNDQIPLVNSRTDDAYVANGVLVVDYSFLKPLINHIVNNGVALEVPLYDFHLVGQITKDSLLYSQGFGRWSLDSFQRELVNIAAFLSACDPTTFFVLKHKLPQIANGAADLPVDVAASDPTQPCTAISSTWAADAFRGSIGAYQVLPTPDGGTPCGM
jgi:hypothetical protein